MHQEKYSEEDWKKISYLPIAIGYLIGGADNKDLFGSNSEQFETLNAFRDGTKFYKNNHLITAITLPFENITNKKQNMIDVMNFLFLSIEENNIKNTDDFCRIILEDCESVVKIIDKQEANEIVNEYKKWLLEIAVRIAKNSKEGSFLSFGGKLVSKEEKRIFQKLKSVLA